MLTLPRRLPRTSRSDPAVARRACAPPPGAVLATVALVVAGCTETFDAGSTRPRGLLPVDERNPIVLLNDGAFDNWQGEYAVLLAGAGEVKLAGIVVGTSGPWPEIERNASAWRELVKAARGSGLQNIPDPITSTGGPLERPSSGAIDETRGNRSEGALLIVDAASRLSLPYRPLVVATGGRLTDVANAYLIDPTVVDRVVVVSSLGSLSAAGAAMGPPNGEMDPWADSIVTARFRYVQVSTFYDQLTDVPAARLSDLPDNDLGTWIRAKQPEVWDLPEAADQVALLAVALPGFATAVERVSAAGPVGPGATAGPELSLNPGGTGWLVTRCAGAVATTRLWQLLDPATFAR